VIALPNAQNRIRGYSIARNARALYSAATRGRNGIARDKLLAPLGITRRSLAYRAIALAFFAAESRQPNFLLICAVSSLPLALRIQFYPTFVSLLFSASPSLLSIRPKVLPGIFSPRINAFLRDAAPSFSLSLSLSLPVSRNIDDGYVASGNKVNSREEARDRRGPSERQIVVIFLPYLD